MSPLASSGLTFRRVLRTRYIDMSTFRDEVSALTLHSSKDLAVSSSLFYPYSEAKPITLGLGFVELFNSTRFCSHLCGHPRQVLPATVLHSTFRNIDISGGSARTFLCRLP